MSSLFGSPTDQRDGFYFGRRVRAFVEPYPYGVRKKWRAAIEREFVNWSVIEDKTFKTEEEANEWADERLRQITTPREELGRTYLET